MFCISIYFSPFDMLFFIPFFPFFQRWIFSLKPKMSWFLFAQLQLANVLPALQAESFSQRLSDACLWLAVARHKGERPQQFLQSMLSFLQSDGQQDFGQVKHILHAKVPILMFTHLASGVEVDLCAFN
jgi:hypothetical protein